MRILIVILILMSTDTVKAFCVSIDRVTQNKLQMALVDRDLRQKIQDMALSRFISMNGLKVKTTEILDRTKGKFLVKLKNGDECTLVTGGVAFRINGCELLGVNLTVSHDCIQIDGPHRRRITMKWPDSPQTAIYCKQELEYDCSKINPKIQTELPLKAPAQTN